MKLYTLKCSNTMTTEQVIMQLSIHLCTLPVPKIIDYTNKKHWQGCCHPMNVYIVSANIRCIIRPLKH